MNAKHLKALFLVLALLFGCSGNAYARSNAHHAVNMGRNLLNVVASPVKALFVKGPADVKAMWQYEVWGREKAHKRGLWRNRAMAVWMVPGVMGRAMVDGVVDSVTYAGRFTKEFISIPFGDD